MKQLTSRRAKPVARAGSITLTIHGLVAFNDEVDGEVFAEKFSAFMKGLASSDEAANGERRHKFVISDLRKNTATAAISERPIKSVQGMQSGAEYYERSLEEIRQDSPAARLLPTSVVKSIASVSKGASEKFEFGEVKIGEDKIIRLDAFLFERAERVLADIKRKSASPFAYRGGAFSSFSGVLRAIDYQPTMKRGTIRLSAGDVPITCNIGKVPIEHIKEAIERPAVFYGLAHYDGISNLPTLFDIQFIELPNPGKGLARWGGKFSISQDDEERWDSN